MFAYSKRVKDHQKLVYFLFKLLVAVVIDLVYLTYMKSYFKGSFKHRNYPVFWKLKAKLRIYLI